MMMKIGSKLIQARKNPRMSPKLQFINAYFYFLNQAKRSRQSGTNINQLTDSSGGGRVRELSVVCLHNNAFVAKGILVTILHCGTPEPHLSAIYIVSSVGTSLYVTF